MYTSEKFGHEKTNRALNKKCVCLRIVFVDHEPECTTRSVERHARKGYAQVSRKRRKKREEWEACVQSRAFTAREDTHGFAVQDKALSASQQSAHLKGETTHTKTGAKANQARTPNEFKNTIRETWAQ